MVGSPRNLQSRRDEQREEEEEEDEQNKKPHQRLCDFCGESTALVYCRADSAKLCFSCDREVHSTNPLFSKHARSQLCDSCDSTPASIRCSTENLVLCQNCDWENHGRSLSSIHDRRPLESFSGCPSAVELSSILGFEDLGDKSLLQKEEDSGDFLVGSEPSGEIRMADGFLDMLVWDSPPIVSLDDLIASADSSHNFQAMGIPHLPKNRNAACGKHKEEILRQLRQLVKLEPGLNNDHGEVEPFLEFPVPEQYLQPGNMATGFEHDVEPRVVPNEASSLQCNGDSCETADQVSFPFSLLGSYVQESSLVLDKPTDSGGGGSHACGGHEKQSKHPKIAESSLVLPKFAPHELIIHDRDSVISRYKEKRKTRRFDRHIRYESRKARAESRTRIKGRFAKVDH